MTKRTFSEAAAAIAAKLEAREGLFLSARHDGRDNVMTIGWGSIGLYWGKPVMVVPVRHSRFTLPLIEKSGYFTVSIPGSDLKEALGYCGTASGRDGDKWKPAGISPAPAQAVPAPVVAEAIMHIECRVALTLDMASVPLPEDIAKRWYAESTEHKGGDVHKMLYGEIVSIWSE